ncbi:MAG: helix-turn-helix transcriptional regulator [Treponema sp.]|nr:helix-turn-helix transcriptional regulator [Treponema sp.]
MTNLRQVPALNMKEKRRTLGFSQAKLAEKVNTAPTYIAMIELEKKFPSVEMLERIAEALQMDTTELFSAESLPRNSIKKLHKSILIEFQKIVERKLKGL